MGWSDVEWGGWRVERQGDAGCAPEATGAGFGVVHGVRWDVARQYIIGLDGSGRNTGHARSEQIGQWSRVMLRDQRMV
jgi:hypothetical protein